MLRGHPEEAKMILHNQALERLEDAEAKKVPQRENSAEVRTLDSSG